MGQRRVSRYSRHRSSEWKRPIRVSKSMFVVEAIAMPRKKKAQNLTTEEAMKRLFPKKVREELYRVAHEKDDRVLKPKRKTRSQD